MTDHDLHILLRDHVSCDEPAFTASPAPTIERGRRTVSRRRALTGGVCAVALASVIGVGMSLQTAAGELPSDRQDAATQPAYDAGRTLRLIDDRARAVFGGNGIDLPEGERSVRDSQGTQLPRKHWDKASEMALTYTPPGHEYRISLLHSGEAADADPSTFCDGELANGYALTCDTVDVDGRMVVQATEALRRTADGEWKAVPRTRVANVDPDDLWFGRWASDGRSETLVVTSQEVVKAPSLETANFTVSSSDLVSLATDAELTMPAPPTGVDGCVWTMPVTGSTDAGDQEECPGQTRMRP